MSIIVVNSSQNRAGHTVALAEKLLEGQAYNLLHLNDFQLAQLGQDKSFDQFPQVFEQIDQADLLVFGTPIYWHDMTGSLKLLIDRLSEDADWESSHMASKGVILIAQGAAPSRRVLDHCDFMFQRFCDVTGMNYLGMVNSSADIATFQKKAGF